MRRQETQELACVGVFPRRIVRATSPGRPFVPGRPGPPTNSQGNHCVTGKVTTTTTNLDYAPPLPLRKRRSFRRAVAVMLLALAAGLGLMLGPRLWREAQIQYWQRACLQYDAPADRVVCEEAPAWAGNMPPFLSAAPPPAPLAELGKLARPAAAAVPGPVLYLHERRTPAGRRYLVIIRRVPPNLRQSWDAPLGLDVELSEPKAWWADPAPTAATLEPDPFPRAFEAQQDTPSLRIFAGRTDPDDPARFTIEFETADGRGVLEGTLRDPVPPAPAATVAWRVR